MIEKLKKEIFKTWFCSGYTDICGEWVSTRSKYYKWIYKNTFGNINDYYLVLNRSYKKGYSASVYLSRTNCTDVHVDTAYFETQKQCKNWFVEALSIIESHGEVLNSVCLKLYKTKKYLVIDHKTKKELLTGFGSSAIHNIGEMLGPGEYEVHPHRKAEGGWHVRIGGWGSSGSSIKNLHA